MLYFSIGDCEYVFAAPFDALQCMFFFFRLYKDGKKF